MFKIMIIEDDPLIAGLYEKAFKANGYDADSAFDGKEGLKKLMEAEKKPTLILSDVMMPEMNGLELLQKIKADPNLKGIPVVMLTNLSGDKDAETALTIGAITYLVKSQYTPKEVVAKVKEIIGAYTRDGEVVPDTKILVKKLDKK